MNDTKQEQLKGNTIMEEGNLSYFEAVLLTAVILYGLLFTMSFYMGNAG